jgi:hypothetical protein
LARQIALNSTAWWATRSMSRQTEQAGKCHQGKNHRDRVQTDAV